jgi:hypothetical protein
MSTNPRDYNCKDEELPVIGGFVLSNMEKDLADFTAYSPKFDAAYVSNFESLNAQVSELVTPAEETVQLKTITTRLYGNMKKLQQPLNWLENYLEMAEGLVPVSVADFGISGLRQAITLCDAENVLKQLRVVNRNIVRYTDALTAQGFTAEQADLFVGSVALIDQDNNAQHAILSNRAQMVEANIGMLNGLNAIIKRVCKTGKALYKGSKPAKVPDYTFSDLKKEVRHQAKMKEALESGQETPTGETVI